MTQVQIKTNSFAVTRLPQEPFQQFDVIVSHAGSEINRRRAYEIIDRLQTKTRPDLFPIRATFDGKKNLFALAKIQLPGYFEVRVNMSDREPGTARSLFDVTLKCVQTIDTTMLNAVLRRDNTFSEEQTQVIVNVLQLLIRQAPSMEYPHNARSIFTPAGRKSLPGGVEICQGFFQSVRPTVGQMVINIDITSAVMVKGGSLIDVVLDFFGERDIRRFVPLSPADARSLKAFLKGLVVNTRTDRKARRISGIEPAAGRHEFEKDGVLMTVEEYFQGHHNIKLQHPGLFGVKTGRTAVVPAELCKIQPGQFYKRTLTPNQTKEVLQFTTKKPAERLRMIEQAQGILKYAESDYIRQAQMVVDPNAMIIGGHILPPPKLGYGENKSLMPRDGVWNVLQQKLCKAASIPSYAFINFDSKQFRSPQSFAQMFLQCCASLGMRLPPGDPPIIDANPSGDVKKELMRAGHEAVNKFKSITNCKKPSLIICILPENATELRKQIKHWGDVEHGIATQCLRSPKLGKANNQYANNVALKVNAKLGGVNSVALGGIEILNRKPTMVIGADVSHPAPDRSHQPSITSLVASYDQFAAQYVAFSQVQPPRLEIIVDMESMFAAALECFGQYWSEKRLWPAQIIFYRDGVSDGELGKVREAEISAIQRAIDATWTKHNIQLPKPSITFIIVTKRHHQKFFPRPQEADRTGNCKPGLSVDQGITGTNPRVDDFYLLSHAAILGTSRPSHYMVIRNDEVYTMQQLQTLSYSLCYVYARATRAVSIPAPVYYADLVCARAGFHFADNLAFSDTATVSSEGNVPFDLNTWTRGYLPVHKESHHDRTMYWM